MWVSTVFSVKANRAAMARFERPSAIAARMSCSRAVSASIRSRVVRRPRNWATTSRVEHSAAAGDRSHSFGEHRNVEDVVFQEIAEPLRVRPGQIERVPAFDALRQQQDPDGRPAAPDLYGGDRPFVREGRGHPYVDEREVGLVGLDGIDECVGVADGLHDLVTGLHKEPDQSFTEEYRVIGDHDPQGITA